MKMTVGLLEIELKRATQISVTSEDEPTITGIMRQLQWYLQAKALDGGQKPYFSINRTSDTQITLDGDSTQTTHALNELGKLTDTQRDEFLVEIAAAILTEVFSAGSSENREKVMERVQEIYSITTAPLVYTGSGRP